MAETTEQRKAAVLDGLAAALRLHEALELAGVPESTYRYWRSSDPAFDAQMATALRTPPDMRSALVEEESPMAALERRVTALEQEQDTLRVLVQLLRPVLEDARTMRALHLWAQRTVGQSRGPLPDLVHGLAAMPEPPEAA